MKATFSRRHYSISGREIGLPLLDNGGYNAFHAADPLNWHTHHGFEYVFLLEGSASYEDKRGQIYRLKGGEFFLLPPGTLHRASENFNEPCEMCWLVFAPARPLAAHHTPFTGDDLKIIIAACKRVGNDVRPMNRLLRQTVERFRDALMEHASANPRPLTAVYLRSIVCQLILEATLQIEAFSAAMPGCYVAAAITYMKMHLAENVRIPDIVRHLGFSESYTYAMFKGQTGQSPNDYLLRLRIQKAKELLCSSSRSITQVAEETGFNSSQYFARSFRKYAGQTPTEYRQGSDKKDLLGRHSLSARGVLRRKKMIL